MTDTYNDTTGSRKKFLIPLVVLLLCAVSLTGAGYAYNSTVTVNGNDMTGDEFVLEVYDGPTGSKLVQPLSITEDMLVLTHVTSITSGADSVVVSATAGTGFVGKLTVHSETGDAYTVSANEDIVKTINDITYDTDKTTTNAIKYTIHVGLYTNVGCTDAYVGGGSDADLTLYYKITVVVSTTANENNLTFANADAKADVDLVKAAIHAAVFDLTFEANTA